MQEQLGPYRVLSNLGGAGGTCEAFRALDNARRHRFCWAIGLAVLTLAPLPRAVADSADFEMRLVDGRTVTGPLIEITGTGSGKLGGPHGIGFAADEWISLQRHGGSIPPRSTDEQVILANGDCVIGTVLKLAADRLTVRAVAGRDIIVPMTDIALVWLGPTPDVAAPADALRLAGAHKSSSDRLWLRNGDQLAGLLTGLDREHTATIEDKSRNTSVEFSRMAMIALNPELAHVSRPGGVLGHVVLQDGSRLTLTKLGASPVRLFGRAAFGADIDIDLDRVMAIELYQGPAVYLSDLEPKSAESQSFLGGKGRPIQRDRNSLGNELLLGRSSYDKGLGLHSACRVTYELGGKYRRFEAWAGLDDQDGAKGSAIIEIAVDDKIMPLRRGGKLDGSSGVLPLSIDIRGARTLRIQIDFGEFADIQDVVDLGDARLIR